MPRILFYAGTAFFLFLALSAATDAVQQLQGSDIAFVAVQGAHVSTSATAGWAIVVALLAGVACAALLVRMAALLAARNLFGAFLALFSVAAAVTSLIWLLFLQTRMLTLARHGSGSGAAGELHFAAVLMLGYFVSISLLALRPSSHSGEPRAVRAGLLSAPALSADRDAGTVRRHDIVLDASRSQPGIARFLRGAVDAVSRDCRALHPASSYVSS